MQQALREIHDEVAALKHRLDTGGFAAFEDGTVLYRSLSRIMSVLETFGGAGAAKE